MVYYLSERDRDLIAKAEQAYTNQCTRINNRLSGQYGPYTNQDWQDVNDLYRAFCMLVVENRRQNG